MSKKKRNLLILFLFLIILLYFIWLNVFKNDRKHIENNLLNDEWNIESFSTTTRIEEKNDLDIWLFLDWVNLNKKSTIADKSSVKNLLINSNKWYKLLNIETNTVTDISYNTELLTPKWMDSTPINYLYFIDNNELGFYNIQSKEIKSIWFPTFNCPSNCVNVIRSFSNTEHFLILWWHGDDGWWYSIKSWFLLNIEDLSVINLGKNTLSSIWWRDCNLALDWEKKVLYKLRCDWDDENARIDLQTDLIEVINFSHEYFGYVWGFLRWYDRSNGNKVSNLNLYDLYNQKMYKNVNSEKTLNLPYDYYVDQKSNTIISLNNDLNNPSYCFDTLHGNITLINNVDIYNGSSIIDPVSNIMYISTKKGIQTINITDCIINTKTYFIPPIPADVSIPQEQRFYYRIEWFIE
jgi:hypothetical protein